MRKPRRVDGHRVRGPTKKYIELTTLSLLDKRDEWERFGQQLSEGGLLIVVPEGTPHLSSLLEIARSFRDTGREVEIHTV